MKNSLSIFILCFSVTMNLTGQTAPPIDYLEFTKLTEGLEEYRESRRISIELFNKYSKEPNTIILDTRSKRAYKAIHIKGAIHLNFSDFSKYTLTKLIPDKNTRILIYCNNNFESNDSMLATKSPGLALNIPTFINLYGYGYKNIYELGSYLSEEDERVVFERNRNKKQKDDVIFLRLNDFE